MEKIYIFLVNIFFITTNHKPSLGLIAAKIWTRSAQLFWHLLETNKQTNEQSI